MNNTHTRLSLPPSTHTHTHTTPAFEPKSELQKFDSTCNTDSRIVCFYILKIFFKNFNKLCSQIFWNMHKNLRE